jgi:DNA-binding Lrp family transcriptional regulator
MTSQFGNPTIDATDQRILTLLREDARASTSKLGRKLGLSRTTVQSRIERLLARGIIAGFTVRLSDEIVRGQIQAHVMIKTLPKLASRVESELRRTPEVRKLYAISGEHDFIAVLITDSVRSMDVLLDRIGVLEGVDRTDSSIVLSTRIDR